MELVFAHISSSAPAFFSPPVKSAFTPPPLILSELANLRSASFSALATTFSHPSSFFLQESFNVWALPSGEIRTSPNDFSPAGNEIRASENEILAPAYKILPANNEILPANNEILLANNEILQANNETLQANNETLQANNETLQANNETLQANNEILQANNEILPAKKLPTQPSNVLYRTK